MVKVVCSQSSKALYFSRSPIPFSASPGEDSNLGLKHLGLYVYRTDTLRHFTSLPPSALEMRERLEQLRALENGIDIHVEILPLHVVSPSIEVDTPEDLEKACAFARSLGE